MQKKPFTFGRFMSWSAQAAGKPFTFAVALLLLSIWLLIGLLYGVNNTWLLVINTIATINASLMVFIIQNTQIRESKALQIKLDELIRATSASSRLILISQ